MTEGAEWTDIAAIYIFSYGKNTMGNRLYGFNWLPSKMSGEWSGYPLYCFDYMSTCGAYNRHPELEEYPHDITIFRQNHTTLLNKKFSLHIRQGFS